MKQLSAILILAFSLFSLCIDVKAEPTTERKDINISKTRDTYGNNGRPRKPAKNNEIECFYQDGYLHISFECPEGNAILSISDITDTPCLTQPFSSSIPFTIYIGEIEFPMGINITTDSCIYEGILSL